MFDDDEEVDDGAYVDHYGNVTWGRDAEEAMHNDLGEDLAEHLDPNFTEDSDANSLF